MEENAGVSRQETLRRPRFAGLGIYITPRMLLIAALGIVSGLPLALTASTLTAWLADSGVTKEAIGLFALLGIPYTFKFLWAPLMDGLSPPLGRKLGRRRAWMVWCFLALAAVVFAMSVMDVEQDLHLIALLTLILAFSASSLDINVDALRIEWMADEEQGAAAVMAVQGYRIGMVVSSAGTLYIADAASWALAYQATGVLILFGLIPALLAPNISPPPLPDNVQENASETSPARADKIKSWFLAYVVGPFRQFSTQQGWWLILLFILLFKLGEAILGFMTNPFLLEMGYSKSDIATVVKIYGLGATIAASFFAGWAVIRFGIFKCLIIGGILQSAANLPYAYLAMLPGPDNVALGVTIAIDNAFGSFATISVIAYISRLCDKRFSGTQYALLNSFATFGRTFLSSGSGWMATTMGWPLFFVATAIIGLPSLIVLWWLRSSLRGEPKA